MTHGFARIVRAYARHAPAFAVPAKLAGYLDGHFAVNPQPFVARTRDGFEIEGETRDLVQRSVFLHGVWEPALTAWLRPRLQPGDVFVDVGANVGYFTLLASRLVGGDGKVVGIEASPTVFRRLVSNVRRNGATNVRLVQTAITDREGVVHVFLAPEDNLGATSIFGDRTFTDEGPVPTRGLSRVLREDEVSRARVIKIDVEGAEQMAVRGLLPSLAKAREDLELVVEVGGGPKGSPSAAESSAEIIARLKPEGFHAYQVKHRNASVRSPWGVRTGSPVERLRADRIDTESDLVFSRIEAEAL